MKRKGQRVDGWLVLDKPLGITSFKAVATVRRLFDAAKPVAVVPVVAETTCCIAASYEAKAFGVKTGTGVAEARQLCPGIRFVEARPRERRQAVARHIVRLRKCVTCRAFDEAADQRFARRKSHGMDDHIQRAPLGSQPREGRIDHCFVSPALKPALSRAWIDQSANGSDHWPMFVELDPTKLAK